MKKSWLSKTLWTNLILAVGSLFIPNVNTWVAAHPEVVVIIFTVVNVILRAVTKDKLELW